MVDVVHTEHLLSLRGHFQRSVSADTGVQVCVRIHLGVSVYQRYRAAVAFICLPCPVHHILQ